MVTDPVAPSVKKRMRTLLIILLLAGKMTAVLSQAADTIPQVDVVDVAEAMAGREFAAQGAAAGNPGLDPRSREVDAHVVADR